MANAAKRDSRRDGKKLTQQRMNKMITIQATKGHAIKIRDIVSAGLCEGVGKPKPGAMCIMAAKRYAFELSHGDSNDGLPVGHAVRSFDISLNDSNWSSNEARAKGMARLGVAELGSDTIDQGEFAKRLAVKTIRQIVPIALRAAASCQKEPHKPKLLEMAKACETAKTLDAASAARAASYAARAASAADAASYAADAASYAADAASYAARAASYAARAASYAARAASDSKKQLKELLSTDKILSLMAEIGVEVLKELKCPGSKWLTIFKTKKPKE